MAQDAPPTIHLEDYKPAPYLIDDLHLDFSLEPHATRVTSRLRMQPNPASRGKECAAGARLARRSSLSREARWQALEPSDYALTDSDLTIPKVPAAPFALEIVTECNPIANTAAFRPLSVERHFLHAMRGGRLPAHHLFLRPARCDGALHGADGSAEGGLPGPAVQRQSGGAATSRAPTGTSPIWDDPHPKPAYLFALVAGDLAGVA